MGSPIVYFEIAGPDRGRLRSFFNDVFGWDFDDALARVESCGGSVVLPRTVVPGVVTFALFRDPAGNLLGVAENGSFPIADGPGVEPESPPSA